MLVRIYDGIQYNNIGILFFVLENNRFGLDNFTENINNC